MRYQIVVDGRLSPRFAARLKGATIERQGRATVLLAKVDTAAELDSLLKRMGDLGLELVSLRQTRRDRAAKRLRAHDTEEQ